MVGSSPGNMLGVSGGEGREVSLLVLSSQVRAGGIVDFLVKQVVAVSLLCKNPPSAVANSGSLLVTLLPHSFGIAIVCLGFLGREETPCRLSLEIVSSESESTLSCCNCSLAF